MTKFYLDTREGVDANVGDRSKPWKTLAKLQASITSGAVKRGDTVFFRCGQEWYGNISGLPISSPFVAPIKFTSYGAGLKPKLLGYKVLNEPSGWVSTGSNLWVINLAASSGSYTGNTSSDSANIGFLLVNGAIKGEYKSSVGELISSWQFTYDDSLKTLTVYSVENPANGNDVRAAPKQNGVEASSALIVSGLHIEGFGGHGWRTNGAHGVIDIIGNDFVNIGGSTLADGSRFGNGGEAWIGSYDVRDMFNTYKNVYDAGSTAQGTVEASRTSWSNITFAFNTYINCNQTFEVWASGNAPTGGFRNVKFTNNVSLNSGKSWGSVVRPDKVGKGNHLMTYQMDLPVDITVSNNIFHGFGDVYRYHRHRNADSSYSYSIPQGFKTSSNMVIGLTSSLIMFNRSEQFAQFDAWKVVVNAEKDSVAVYDNDIVNEISHSEDGRMMKITINTVTNLAVARALISNQANATAFVASGGLA